MRLQTKPDELTSATKIPHAPQTDALPSVVQAESRLDRVENVIPKSHREKVASPKPLGNRVAGVLAVCATVFAAAALWRAPTESRFTPSGFVEGATRATETVWYENIRIALAEKNLEARRIDTAASLILASSPTQLHPAYDLTAIRKKILTAAIRKSDWNTAIKLALGKSILQSSIYENNAFMDLFWVEVSRTGNYARVREVVSKLPSSEKSSLLTALSNNLTRYDLTYLGNYSMNPDLKNALQETVVCLSASELQEWIRAYPNSRLLRWKELVSERGQVPVLDILAKLRLLEAKYPLKANETDSEVYKLKNRLIQDLVEAGQVDTALSQYRELFPGNSTTQKINFVQKFSEFYDIETLNALLKDGVKLLKNEVNVMPGENIKFLRFDTALMNIGTLSRAISDSKKQDAIAIQNISAQLLELEKQRRTFLNLRRSDLK